MSIAPSLPGYAEVTTALKKTPGRYNASQVHGLMCGLICAISAKDSTRWEGILGIAKDPEGLEVLQRLYETSYHQMSEFSFEFTLLLPSDKTEINKRAEALGLWCQGFLTGLEQGKVPIKNREPGEVTEALDDFIEISQVNYDDTATTDEDETAYFELVEYVRLAALMVYQELRSENPPILANSSSSLH
jgi:uncharacterized protein YgfB (UPF0149 family)